MNTEKKFYQGTWKQGILFFTGVSGSDFNELHVTVTNATADCGKGFHFSAYQKGANLQQLGTKVGALYFSFDEGAFSSARLAHPAPWGNHNAISNSFFYNTFLTGAEQFYCECFGLKKPAENIAAMNFPALTSTPKSKPAEKPTMSKVPDANVSPASVAAPSDERIDMLANRLASNLTSHKGGYSLF